MFPDLLDYAEWLKSIPAAFASVILYLIEAPKRLDAGAKDGPQRKRWIALQPKLLDALRPNFGLGGADPNITWGISAFYANLAACILNFSYPDTPAGNQALVRCAQGLAWFNPANQNALLDALKDSEDLQKAITNGTAFGQVPQTA